MEAVTKKEDNKYRGKCPKICEIQDWLFLIKNRGILNVHPQNLIDQIKFQ